MVVIWLVVVVFRLVPVHVWGCLECDAERLVGSVACKCGSGGARCRRLSGGVCARAWGAGIVWVAHRELSFLTLRRRERRRPASFHPYLEDR